MAEPAKKLSCLDMLTVDVVHQGWSFTVGLKRSYYIRGATWFRNNVYRDPSKIGEFMADYERLLSENRDWLCDGFNWDEKFSPRQAYNALRLTKREPLRFDKATSALLLCAAAAESASNDQSSGATRADVFNNMWIEPAVFYIRDFDTDKLFQLRKERTHLLDELREHCQQTTSVVFTKMAGGETVTKRLAENTKKYLEQEFPGLNIGSVDFRLRENSRPAAREETLSD